MVEAIANSCEGHLISSLSFKFDPTAPYATNRKSAI